MEGGSDWKALGVLITCILVQAVKTHLPLQFSYVYFTVCNNSKSLIPKMGMRLKEDNEIGKPEEILSTMHLLGEKIESLMECIDIV